MKRYICLTLFFVIFALSGCSNSQELLTHDDYLLNNETTSKNIQIGSVSEEFINAYKNNRVTVSYVDSDDNVSQETNVENIDYLKSCYVLLPTFFIDDKPIDINSFMERNDITNFEAWIKNTDYLAEHSVVSKCLIFYFENGVVVDIQYSENIYNE